MNTWCIHKIFQKYKTHISHQCSFKARAPAREELGTPLQWPCHPPFPFCFQLQVVMTSPELPPLSGPPPPWCLWTGIPIHHWLFIHKNFPQTSGHSRSKYYFWQVDALLGSCQLYVGTLLLGRELNSQECVYAWQQFCQQTFNEPCKMQI